MANITRDEAHARAALLSVQSYDISLDLTSGDEDFGSTSTVVFDCAEPGRQTFVELTGVVRSVVLNGVELTDAVSGDRIHLPDLAAHNTLTVVADARYSHSGEGLHRFVDPADDAVYLYSQCAVYDAQRIFACFDQPDLKARFTLTVTADPSWTVLSNTPVAEQDGGVTRFEQSEVMSTYLFAVCAGDYVGVHAEHDGIALGLWTRRAQADHLDAEEVFAATRTGLDFYQQRFGVRYPFGRKYDQVMVPEFNLGAMENPGCVTFREEMFVHRSRVTEAEHAVTAEVVQHEMAHMWFGNLVTMTWWDDLWLNESFADYMGYRVPTEMPRFADNWTSFCVGRKAQGYAADQRPTTHPVAGDLPDLESALLNFDGISYAKGASVLKQLVARIGEDAFLAGVRAYFAEHAYGNTELADLLRALSASSGQDLAAWSAVWLEQAGVNTLSADVATGDGGTYDSVRVLQTAPAEHPTLRPHRINVGLYDLTGDALVRRTTLAADVDGATTDLPALVGEPAADLLLLNEGDLTFAKIRLGERSRATLLDHVEALPDSMARALSWAYLWDLVRDAELSVTEFVTTAVRALPRETHAELLSRVLAQARLGIDRFAAPEHRAGLLAELAACARRQVGEQAPDSDAQLAFARAFVGAAGESDVDTVRRWLAGEDVPEGLAIGRELRWSALGRLAVLGAIGLPDIDAELAEDRSQAGQVAAAYARSALPDPGSKAAAWSALFADDRLPNSHLERISEGFWQVEHAEVLQPYVERFFTDITDVASRRTAYMVIALAFGAYPHTLVEPATLAASQAFLAAGPATILRRVISERQADLERDLAAQARDAAG